MKSKLLATLAVLSLAGNVALFILLNASKTTVLYRDVHTAVAAPQPKTDDESDQVVSRVRRLMAIPDDPPTVATVTDLDKLRNQPFFAKAKQGDKVLIFSASKKVILYDPIADQVVNVAPLSVNSGTGTRSL